MRLITSVRVAGFRSIEETALHQLGPFTVLVGRNNSGKSNLVRALNLFFSNEPEPGRLLDFAVDHHTIPLRKKRKGILVEVGFDLSDFNLREDIRASINRAFGARFVLRKRWTLSRQLQPVLEYQVSRNAGADFSDVDEDAVRSLIGLVNFRYIPNRTVPTEILASRRAELARAISKRVERTGAEAAQALVGRIRDAATAALEVVDSEISTATEGISRIEAGVSDAIPDLISLSDFRGQSALGTSIPDYAWGSGAQSFLMFSVLHAIDRDRSGYFGWRQGTVWAVEEPESSLHHDLCIALAQHFHDWTAARADRLQIICTTHSEVFTMCSDGGYEVTLQDGKTHATSRAIPLLTANAARTGVSAWPQPLLAFPFNPIVLVEGRIDSRVLSHASKILGVAANSEFLAPSELDPAVPDGADNLVAYLQRFGNLWTRRAPEAPLILLFDWDRAGEPAIARGRALFAQEANDRVIVMSEASAHRNMGEQWRGIERFYSPAFIAEAVQAGIVNAGQDTEGNWLVGTANLRAAKGPLSDRLLRSVRPRDFAHLKKILQQVNTAVAVLTAGYYQTAFAADEAGP